MVAAVFKSESIPVAERLHPEQVVAALNVHGTPAALYADADAIVERWLRRSRVGDVVAILSNGGFGDIYEKLPATLECADSCQRLNCRAVMRSAICSKRECFQPSN